VRAELRVHRRTWTQARAGAASLAGAAPVAWTTARTAARRTSGWAGRRRREPRLVR